MCGGETEIPDSSEVFLQQLTIIEPHGLYMTTAASYKANITKTNTYIWVAATSSPESKSTKCLT